MASPHDVTLLRECTPPLFATPRSVALPQFLANGIACLDRRFGFKLVATEPAHIFEEHGHRAAGPDLTIAEYFNGVLQLMSDGSHQIAIRRPRVDEDEEHSVWAGYRHRV